LATGIHETALVGPEVVLGEETEVGPFCRFEGDVTVGSACRFATGVVVGAAPMDREYAGEETGVAIGNRNVFHEYTTLHRATGAGNTTVVGNDNYIMAYVHIAHNCRVGDGCTITNGTQLAGHVEVGDRANIGGLVGIHQYCRIGELAMVGAHSYVNRDIPPFVVAQGFPCRVRSLNMTGLGRAGVPVEAVAVLKRAFRLLYRASLNLAQAMEKIEQELMSEAGPGAGQEQLESLASFIGSSKRGVELRESGDVNGEQEES
jgi:UDP-N-acetylglucosamine acyltransferase